MKGALCDLHLTTDESNEVARWLVSTEWIVNMQAGLWMSVFEVIVCITVMKSAFKREWQPVNESEWKAVEWLVNERWWKQIKDEWMCVDENMNKGE